MSFILYLLQASVCLAIFYVFYVIALHRQTAFAWNRLYLVTTLFFSMIIPMVTIPMPEDPNIFVLPAQEFFTSTVTIVASSAVQSSKLDWKDVLLVVYLLVTAIPLTRLAVEVIRLLSIRKHGKYVIVNGHSCILSDQVQMPFSFFHMLVIPALPKYTEEELEHIIRHETAHIRGRHSWDVMIMELAGIILWFNPFIYFYKKRIREVHEYIADAAVVKHTTWDTYTAFLLRQKSNGLELSVSNPLLQSQLEKRLRMLTKKSTNMISRLKYLGIVPLVFLSSILVSCERLPDLSTHHTTDDYSANIDTLPATVVTAYHTSERDTLPNRFSSGTNEEEPYTYVEVMPRFPGCEDLPEAARSKCGMEKLNHYLYSNIKYPVEDRKKGNTGMVIAQFTIEKDGSVSDIKIVRSVSPGLDAEAIRIIESMNSMTEKWIPGYHNGKPVRVQFTLPFKFQLESGKKSTGISSEEKLEKPFTYVEDMPRYPGCEHLPKDERTACASEKLYDFIFSNIMYPSEDRKNGNQGTVIAQFTIEKDGSVSDIDILRSVSPGLDAEAVRIIESMSNWVPGYHNGKPVRVRFTLPFKFQLQSKAE